MHRKSTLNQPDEQFLATANTINNECKQHSTEWNLDTSRLTTLNTLTASANAAYTANSDRATKNLTTSVNKKTTFKELKDFLSLFIEYLIGNISVPDSALAIMGIRSRVHHFNEPSPPPNEAPALVVERRHGEVTAYVSRIGHGHPNQSLTSKQFSGFKLRWRFVGETQYHIEISTRLSTTISFVKEDEGKRIEMSAAWVNSRMQEGPWCDDIIEVIG
jgi:hypothetical protein